MKVTAYDLQRKLGICEEYFLKIVLCGASEEDLNKKIFSAKDSFYGYACDWETIKFILKGDVNTPMWSIKDLLDLRCCEITEAVGACLGKKQHNIVLTITPELIERIGKKHSTKMNFIKGFLTLLGLGIIWELEDYLGIEDEHNVYLHDSLPSSLEVTLFKMTWKKLSVALYQALELKLGKVKK